MFGVMEYDVDDTC